MNEPGYTHGLDAASSTALFELCSDLLAVLDFDGRVLVANATWERLLGRHPQDLVGQDLFDVIHPEDVDGSKAHVLGLMSDPETAPYENRYLHVDGSSVWLSWTALIDQQQRRIYAVGKDIRVRKAIQDALVHDEHEIGRLMEDREAIALRLASQASLLKIAGDAMIVCELDDVVTFWNPAAERLYGWPATEAIGRPLVDLVGVETSLESDLHERTDAHAGWAGRAVHRHRDGSPITVDVRTSLVPATIGATGYVFVVISDLSAHVLMEDRLADALDGSRMAAFDYDIVNDVVWRHGPFDDLFGFVPGASTRTRAEYLSHVLDEDLPHLRRREVASWPAGTSRTEFRVRSFDGSTRWLAARSQIVHDHRGVARWARGTLLDITDRKRDEAERMQLEQQLAQARKMEAVGRLAGGIAHDFNNLLTVINGYAELAKRRAQDGPLQAQLDAISLAGARAADLTEQLLSLSRRQQVTLGPVDINRVVDDASRLLRRLIGDDMTLDIRLASGLGDVLGDDGQLSQVVINLAVNARDAMSGSGTITITTEGLDFPGDELDASTVVVRGAALHGRFVRLSVIDAGSGMDSGTIDRAFEPFFTTKSTGEGTGLGLSTVYSIVEQGGGHLDVHSRVGEGSRFDVYLRCALGLGDDDGSTNRRPVADLHDVHVLLVEDDVAVRTLVVEMLEALGVRVTTVESAGDALAMSVDEIHEIDVMLTDVLMPTINGRELAERLLARSNRGAGGDPRVIFMSGFASTVINDEFPLQAGMALLQKPFTMAELRDQLVASLLPDR